MRKQEHAKTITDTVNTLSDFNSVKVLCNRRHEGEPKPSWHILREITELCRALIFPGYFGNSRIDSDTLKYHLGVTAEQLYQMLTEQILAGICSACTQSEADITKEHENAAGKAAEFIAALPEMRRILATDVIAAYNGDPAAESYEEVIFCYPAIRAISNYRMAHKLIELGVPLIPRIISELAHSETGIG